MDLSELHRKLIGAARLAPPNDHVPYAFEKRIMARLAGQKPLDAWALWGQALSRAAIFCVIFMAILSLGSYFLPNAANKESLSQDLDKSLLAAVDNNADQDTW